jgi:hypothetical protein
MRRLALLLTIIALPLGVTATAAANTVTRTVFTIDETELFGAATFVCGFDVYLRTEGSIQETDFFDNSGTLVRQIFTNVGGPIRLTAWNPANGKTATSTGGQGEIIIENPDGSYAASDALNGIVFNFVAPGLGTILLSAGRLDFVTGFVAGPHAFRDQNTDAFCNYLAGA